MPKKEGNYGDLYIEVTVIYPESLTDAQSKGKNINQPYK